MSETKDFRKEEDEEEEEVDESVTDTKPSVLTSLTTPQGYKTVKDAVLFAIDVSESMLKKPPPSDSKNADRDSPTSAALKCAYSLMQQRIISNPNDMMGVLLFGTKESRFQGEDVNSRGGLAYPNIYLLADLDLPDVPEIKRLKALVEDEDEAKRLLIPAPKGSFNLANLLFCANQIFTTKAPNFSSRRLFVVTDNDNPHSNDKQARDGAAVRARDLYDLGVKIELFPISTEDHKFNRSAFFDDIVYDPYPKDPEAPAPMSSVAKPASSGDGITLLQSLLSAINSKASPKRAIFSNLPFEIGPGFRISVKGYVIIKRQEPAAKGYIDLKGEKPEIAVGKTMQMAEDTARTIEKTEIKKAFNFGGEQVTFSKDELTALKNFGDPIIRVIGFKPLEMLPIWATLKPSTFIYPSEEEFVGSTRVFSAMQQKLLRSERFALVWYIARRNASPTLAALIPGAEELSDEGLQVSPPGLWIHPLPFADDIRQAPETTGKIEASQELTDIMHDIIKQLQLPKARYDPKRYPNPALQWHYRVLQAIALEEDMPEQAEDNTVPRYKQIHKRVGNEVIEWGQALEEEFAAWQEQHGRSKEVFMGKKRAAPGAANGASSKKTKHEDEGVIGDDEMRRAYEKHRLDTFKVDDLKAWLRDKRQSTTGKKVELVDRVTNYFENK
ncbi:MAG: ATP-dependent DNA helicase II subunit 1 [Bogoriella megaspora]|nr:MAG: ATP-dependent DNA helicase II subunit 1 [Bogoriella megaspora]